VAVESLRKTLGMALAVCLVCSILVSTSVIALKKKQDRNREIERLKNILIAGDLLEKENNIEKKFQDKIKAAYIELKTGKELPTAEKPPAIIEIDKGSDMAGIKRIPAAVNVYFVKDKGRLDQVILPVYGKGLWSTMYGFLSLDFADLNTIRGITFYEHGETPGLGGEIDNPRWQESWRGKKAFDEKGQVKISLAKGKAAPAAEHEVDGLSGATITARGVKNLVRFWLGEYGYGPFLKRLRKEKING
jgi:Na+-transporting NADH:ubiquinone oxidoreductase subunit C